jgi:ribosomal protein S6
MKYDFMRSYSLTLIVSPDLKEDARKKLLDSVSGFLKDSKGFKSEEWGQKPLTYPIKRQVAGYFAHYSFETENLPEDLEKRIITADGVLRHLLLKLKVPALKKLADKAPDEKAEEKVGKKKTVKKVAKKKAVAKK